MPVAVTGGNHGRARGAKKRRTISQTRKAVRPEEPARRRVAVRRTPRDSAREDLTQPAETADRGALRRELAHLRRENELLRAQLQAALGERQRSEPRGPDGPISGQRRVDFDPERRGAVTPGSLRAHNVVAERYELERLLARGGMGAVWIARDLDDDGSVAIKFLKGEAGPERVARFEREAEVCKRLRSKHVVHVFDHGVDRGNHYLAMELLRGESLSSLLRRVKTLSVAETRQLAHDIADALAPAHAQNIVHRDLKPQNLFLSVGDDGQDRTLKLLDFGVAKELATDTTDMTNSGVIIGSPNYMSPEQAYGVRTVDHRSDLWSVAVILYRVLTGNRPWEGDNPLELLFKVCSEPAPPPSTHVPGLPSGIDAFFETAFAKEPEQRFSSVHALAKAFADAARIPSTPPEVSAETRSPVPSSRGSMLPLSEMGEAQPLSADHRTPSTGNKPAPAAIEPTHTLELAKREPLSSEPLSTTDERGRRLLRPPTLRRRYAPWRIAVMVVLALIVVGAAALLAFR